MVIKRGTRPGGVMPVDSPKVPTSPTYLQLFRPSRLYDTESKTTRYPTGLLVQHHTSVASITSGPAMTIGPWPMCGSTVIFNLVIIRP